jgi:predicted esterase
VVLFNEHLGRVEALGSYLFVPANLAPNAAVPMILMFHGSGRNGLSVVEKWADLAAKEGIIPGS